MTFTWDEALAALAGLELGHGECVLAGSGPLLAHGLVATVGDLDIVLVGPAFERATSSADVVRGRHGDLTAPLGDGIEAFGGWFGEAAASVWERGVTVDGVRVASLDDTLAWKKRLSRPKDAAHIELLRRVLTSDEA